MSRSISMSTLIGADGYYRLLKIQGVKGDHYKIEKDGTLVEEGTTPAEVRVAEAGTYTVSIKVTGQSKQALVKEVVL